MTLPIHPLLGRSLQVVRAVRGPGGQGFVDVEHPAGGTLRLPDAWPDRGHPSPAVVTVAGRAPKATAEGLLKVARVVAAALGDQ